jgi:hypothetical protein
MGYHTNFQGRFHCYRPECPELGRFLETVRSGDEGAIAPLADWLTERGDPRGKLIAARVRRGSKDFAGFWRFFGFTPEHAAYLKRFSETRRMRRDARQARLLADPVRERVGLPLGKQAAYFVGGLGFHGQDDDPSVLDHNNPPVGQPGLWCKWAPTEDGTALAWNRAEKFYDYIEWLEYLIAHFLGPWGYQVNGQVRWFGEETYDRGALTVSANVVSSCYRGD